MEMKTHKIRDTIFLFLTAMIWGAAFVAQSVSMDYIGPFTFICLRSVIGGLFLIPVIMVIDNIRKKRRSESVKTASDNGINSFQKMQAEEEKLSWKNKRLLESGIVCGIFLFLANCFQQTGIQYTTVGKAGFITTFYIIIVPVVGLFFKKYCGILTWIGVVIALANTLPQTAIGISRAVFFMYYRKNDNSERGCSHFMLFLFIHRTDSRDRPL